MSRKRSRAPVYIDSRGVGKLPMEDIIYILRAADDIVGLGGRSLLIKTLKGSKERSVLAHEMDKNPAYGYYKELTLEEIARRVDWMISESYLGIFYSGRLPLLEYLPLGWMIEKKTYAREMYADLYQRAAAGPPYEVISFRDANPEVIDELLALMKDSGKSLFVPYLEEQKSQATKKQRAKIEAVQKFLSGDASSS